MEHYLLYGLFYLAGIFTVICYQANKRVNEYYLTKKKIEDNKTVYQKLNILV